MPWYLIPCNILLNFWLIYQIYASKAMRDKTADLKRYRPDVPDNFLTTFAPDTRTFCQSLPQVDFSYDFIPPNIICCGPILRLSESLSDCDAELKSWIKRRRTIVINLGAMVSFTQQSGSKIAAAIRILLRHDPKQVQILWKVMSTPHIEPAETFLPETVLAAEMEAGSVKIVSWIPVELVTLLREQSIVAVVNHGGSSSWHDAIA